MITVCIYELRNAMRTVQKHFEIPGFGTKHTVPDMSKEIDHLSKALEDNEIQSYVLNRDTNQYIDGRRDLLGEGSKYADTRTAFQAFRKDSRIAENLGQVEPTIGDSGSTMNGDRETNVETYEITQEDLEADEEEPYEYLNNIMSIVDDFDED